MTTKELIVILRTLDCEKCPNKPECHNRLVSAPCMLFEQAADGLEALAAELEAERYRHDRYVDFEMAEAAELAKLKAAIRWIPVTEAMPEKDVTANGD